MVLMLKKKPKSMLPTLKTALQKESQVNLGQECKKTANTVSTSANFSELRRFQNEWNAADSDAVKYRVLRLWWPNIKCVYDMPINQHASVIHSRIGYELQAYAYFVAGIPVPVSVQKNLDALREWKISDLSDNLRRMLEIEIAKNPTNTGDESMVAKKTDGKEKVTRAGVAQFYLEIFESQTKNLLTDVQIAASIKTKTGSEPTLKNIASYRNSYNNGKLAGQNGCPTKVKAVRPPSKAKAKKPMSEETKAKLKAYTAAKKANQNKKVAKKK